MQFFVDILAFKYIQHLWNKNVATLQSELCFYLIMIITIAETIDNHVSWKTRALDDAVSMSESQKAIRSARKSLWFMVRFTSIRRCRVEFSFSGNHSTPWSKASDPLAGTLETIEKWRKVETYTPRLRKSMWFMVKFTSVRRCRVEF